MKFDTVIIGGGLSGLFCGIELAKANQKVAIVSAGQSTLPIRFASFDLLGYDEEGNVVSDPIAAIPSLSASHPYHKVGDSLVEPLFKHAQELLTEAGVEFKGSMERNHFRMTPVGLLKPTCLSLTPSAMIENEDSFPWKNVVLVDIIGFLDFPVEFIAAGIEKLGSTCTIKHLSIPELKVRRKSPSENRSVNVGRILSTPKVLQRVVEEVKNAAHGDVVLLPALIWQELRSLYDELKKEIPVPIYCISTLPPSLPGMNIQHKLQHYFVSLGGTFLQGDKVVKGQFDQEKLIQVETNNLAGDPLLASNYVLASGSFISQGLQSNYERVFEPIFDLDVASGETRSDWTCHNVFDAQPYMAYGVVTDNQFRTQKDGKTIENLYAIGQILNGHNQIKRADGEGVSMLTGLKVAQTIMNK